MSSDQKVPYDADGADESSPLGLRELIRRARESEAIEFASGVVQLGGTFRVPSYVESYALASSALVEEAYSRGRPLNFVLPVLFLQRHTLELALKQVLVLLEDVNEGYEQLKCQTKSEVMLRDAAYARKSLPCDGTHHLGTIVDKVNAALESTTFGSLPPAVIDLVALIESFEDGRIDRARYSHTKLKKNTTVDTRHAASNVRWDAVVSVPLREIQSRLDTVMGDELNVAREGSFIHSIGFEAMAIDDMLTRRWGID